MNTTTAASPECVITDLRALLNERFKGATPDWAQAQEVRGKTLSTGIAEWDKLTDGIRLGEITEICGGLGGAGIMLDHLLETSARAGWLGAWVDAGGTLEVTDWRTESLVRMLWVRCANPLVALKATDLLLRDGNAAWVVLDLQGVTQQALGKISGNYWHRLHRLVEQRENTLVVLTPNALVEGVRVRVAAENRWTLDDLEQPRALLKERNQVRIYVRGRAPQLNDFHHFKELKAV
jgi:hypothetical protein